MPDLLRELEKLIREREFYATKTARLSAISTQLSEALDKLLSKVQGSSPIIAEEEVIAEKALSDFKQFIDNEPTDPNGHPLEP
jgi:endonuclease III-like uncharacterized protein